jgi:hypothetical protein
VIVLGRIKYCNPITKIEDKSPRFDSALYMWGKWFRRQEGSFFSMVDAFKNDKHVVLMGR